MGCDVGVGSCPDTTNMTKRDERKKTIIGSEEGEMIYCQTAPTASRFVGKRGGILMMGFITALTIPMHY